MSQPMLCCTTQKVPDIELLDGRLVFVLNQWLQCVTYLGLHVQVGQGNRSSVAIIMSKFHKNLYQLGFQIKQLVN